MEKGEKGRPSPMWGDYQITNYNTSSAVAEVGDCGTEKWAEKWVAGCCAPFRGESWVPI